MEMDASKQPPQVDEYIYMNSDLFEAAEDGNTEEFKKYEGDLRYLVDGMQNSILHIHIRASIKNWVDKKEFSDKFLGQVIDQCPALLQQTNAEGQIPLLVAAKYGHSTMVEFIIERTKQLERHEDLEKGSTSEATSSRIKQMLRMVDEDGNTPLHKAIESGNVDVVGLLVKELGLDFPFSANKSGETPLYLAAKRGDCDSVNLILDKCYSTSRSFGGPDDTTALHAAVIGGDERTVRKLIERKKDLLWKTDDKGRTPLHYASHLGCHNMAKMLLEMDASLGYIRDKERGSTPLHMAAWKGDIYMMEEIIKYCPSCCDIVDKKYGWNFLHYAFIALNRQGCKRLLSEDDGDGNKFKALPIKDLLNVMDVNGNTPLDVLFLGPAYHLSFNEDGDGISKLFHGYDISIAAYLNINAWKHIKTQQIWESLKEIGNNVQVAGTKVNNLFILNIEDIEKNRKEWQETVDKGREAHLVVVALIATVTFAAAFTMPGGYNQEKGSAIMSHDSAFQAFLITDTLAFVSSLLAIFFHFILAYLRVYIPSFQFKCVLAADGLTFLAMIEMVIAFSTGTYAVLQSSSGFAIATCFLALTFIPGLFFVFYIIGLFLGT